MLKKILIISVLTIKLFSQTSVDYCSINLVEFLADKEEFAEFNQFKRKKQITFKSSDSIASHKIESLSEEINYERPYDSNLSYNFLKLTRNNNYQLDKQYWNVIYNLGIFSISKIEKEKLRNIVINEILSNKKFKNSLIHEKDFKKYLLLKNLNILSQKELLIYKQKIKKNEGAIDYKILDYIKYGKDNYNKNVFFDKGEKFYKAKVNLERIIKDTCYSKDNIANAHATKKIDFFIRIFYLTKLFPEIEKKTKSYFYAISTNTDIWNLLEYYYSNKNKNYKLASFSLENLYMSMNKPKFMLQELSRLNLKRSQNAYIIGNNYEAWIKSKNILENLISIQKTNNGLDKIDFEVSKESKKILIGSAKNIIIELANKNNIKSAKFIRNTTLKLINFIFKRKNKIINLERDHIKLLAIDSEVN